MSCLDGFLLFYVTDLRWAVVRAEIIRVGRFEVIIGCNIKPLVPSLKNALMLVARSFSLFIVELFSAIVTGLTEAKRIVLLAEYRSLLSSFEDSFRTMP